MTLGDRFTSKGIAFWSMLITLAGVAVAAVSLLTGMATADDVTQERKERLQAEVQLRQEHGADVKALDARIDGIKADIRELDRKADSAAKQAEYNGRILWEIAPPRVRRTVGDPPE